MSDLGSDFSCITDITPTLKTVEGIECLAEGLLRRLITPRGGLYGDPHYGTDIRNFLNQSGVTAAQVESAIQTECLKDERVAEIAADVTSTGVGTQTITADIRVTAYNGVSFEFTISVGQLTAAILELRKAA